MAPDLIWEYGWEGLWKVSQFASRLKAAVLEETLALVLI
jgi:hypothetical protein